ncbi:MAG: ATP-binding protein, partial [Verrucomicrobiota bacterium]
LAEILILNGPLNLAVDSQVTVGPSSGYERIGWNRAYLTDFCSPLGPPVVSEKSPTNGLLCEHVDDPDAIMWMQVDLGDAVPVDAVRLLPSRPTDFVDTPGTGFPLQFKIEASDDALFQDRQLIFSSGPEAYPNPGDNPVEIHSKGEVARYVRITATRLSNLAGRYSFSLGEMQVYSEGRNVALGKPVSASEVFDNPRFPRWKSSGLVDGYNSQNRLIELPDWLEGLEERRRITGRLVRLNEERTRKGDTIVFAATTGTWAVSGVLIFGAVSFLVSFRRRKRREAEETRRQISRDLHDDIGGDLGGILLLSEGALQQKGLSEEMREDLEDIHNIAKKSGEALDDIVWLIRDERNLEDLILRLRETAHSMLRKVSHTWTVEPELMPDLIVPLRARRHVFFAFKEALTNILKHAKAETVGIAISYSPAKHLISLRIADDGRGFDLNQKKGGYGLANLRRRCEVLNGSCELESTPGRGTQIELVFSLKP